MFHIHPRMSLVPTQERGNECHARIDVHWTANRPTHLWTFPVETVSQSEGGFELVHQSVAVMPHWFVQGDAEGRWSVTMKLTVDSGLAESRMQQSAVAAEV